VIEGIRQDGRLWPARGRRFLAAAGTLLVPFRAGAADAPALPTKFDPSRDASRDVEAALQLARARRDAGCVEVGGEWCSWCHIMDRFFAANSDVTVAARRALSSGEGQLLVRELE
jgi:hypothetical protein